MAQVISDRRDIEFVLHEQLQAEKLADLNEDFADFSCAAFAPNIRYSSVSMSSAETLL